VLLRPSAGISAAAVGVQRPLALLPRGIGWVLAKLTCIVLVPPYWPVPPVYQHPHSFCTAFKGPSPTNGTAAAAVQVIGATATTVRWNHARHIEQPPCVIHAM